MNGNVSYLKFTKSARTYYCEKENLRKLGLFRFCLNSVQKFYRSRKRMVFLIEVGERRDTKFLG